MSKDNRPRYKERIDIGPDVESVDTDTASDSGRSRTNLGAHSNKPRRKANPQAWLPKP